MRTVHGAWCLVIGALMLSACSSTPSYPPPRADSGQILVQLQGSPREGVSGPKTEEVQEEYSRSRESVEQGRAFERVDYDEIDDVVVIVDAGAAVLTDSPLVLPDATEIEVDEDGFSRFQYLGVRRTRGKATFTLQNSLDREIHVYGFNGNDDYFEQTVSSGTLATFAVSEPGRYEVFCEEEESFSCVLFVADGPFAWIGTSDEDAFFNYMPAGSFEVTVHAPRLPASTKTVTVAKGKRETVTADLTVNDLPKVGE